MTAAYSCAPLADALLAMDRPESGLNWLWARKGQPTEQVRYLDELLDIFEGEEVDTALWSSFANYEKPGDRDIASYGVVRMLDETRWEPKKVFHAMAARYERR